MNQDNIYMLSKQSDCNKLNQQVVQSLIKSWLCYTSVNCKIDVLSWISYKIVIMSFHIRRHMKSVYPIIVVSKLNHLAQVIHKISPFTNSFFFFCMESNLWGYTDHSVVWIFCVPIVFYQQFWHHWQFSLTVINCLFVGRWWFLITIISSTYMSGQYSVRKAHTSSHPF